MPLHKEHFRSKICLPNKIAESHLKKEKKWKMLVRKQLHIQKKPKALKTTYLMSSMYFCYQKTYTRFSFLCIPLKYVARVFRNNAIPFENICSKRLFLTFGNFASISVNTKTFVKTSNKSNKHENSFEQFFHT